MKNVFALLLLTFLGKGLLAQHTYTITADSVKITNCDSAELILENHTQGVPGFLFNTGRGRTQFRRGMLKINNGLYLVGADTLNLAGNAWMQGGNSFGTTGILGTLDNHHLDLYTNGLERMRLDSAGNLLVGTITDNGNKLQVNGASTFSGNVNIGTATITNTGSLIGTNAVLYNHVVSQYHSYEGNDIYVSRLDNVLYNYAYRLNSTTVRNADGSISMDIVFPIDELDTIGVSATGIVYPGGYMCFSFWSGGLPQSVSVTMFDNNRKIWCGPFTTSTNQSSNVAGYFEVPIPTSFNYVNEIKITITPVNGGYINLQNVEYVLATDDEGLANAYPYIGKTQPEHTFNYLYFKNAHADNVRISPFLSVPDYFLNNVLVGSVTDNAGGNKLQVTGNVSATGSVGIGTTTPAAQLHTTGSVRFAGLTSDSTQTRVIVSDANGNLYYRSASSLASNGILNATLAQNPTINSSLAVNGEIRAQKLRLSQTAWPDYVFAGGYHLPTLPELEQYIKHNNHLPGMPAAYEVKQRGIDVGDNQAALLKKIEELTLYAIEQDKYKNEQQKKLEEIEAENKKLMQQVEGLENQHKELETLKQEMSALKRMILNK